MDITQHRSEFWTEVSVIQMATEQRTHLNHELRLSAIRIFDLYLCFSCLIESEFCSGWTEGSKPVGQNHIFTLKPKYYDNAENHQAKMMIRPKNIFFLSPSIYSLLLDPILRYNLLFIKHCQVSCYNKWLYSYL